MRLRYRDRPLGHVRQTADRRRPPRPRGRDLVVDVRGPKPSARMPPVCTLQGGPGRAAALTPASTARTLAVVAEMPDHVHRNRSAWDRWAPDYAAAGQRNWAAAGPTWGRGVPEAQVGVCRRPGRARHHRAWLGPATSRPGLPGAERARSAWISPGAAGRPELQQRFGLRFRSCTPAPSGPRWPTPPRPGHLGVRREHLVRPVPVDPRGGAAATTGRAADLPGQLGSAHALDPDQDDLPATEQLLRPYFGMHRFEWPDDESVEFHLGHGDMIRLLRRCGFEVEDLIEMPPGRGHDRHPLATLEWAQQWPCEKSGRPANHADLSRPSIRLRGAPKRPGPRW